MSRIFAVLIMIWGMLLAPGAGAASDSGGPDSAASGAAFLAAANGTAGIHDHPATDHHHDAAHDCHMTSCSVGFMADRSGLSADFRTGRSAYRIPDNERTVENAALLKDPPVPRLPA